MIKIDSKFKTKSNSYKTNSNFTLVRITSTLQKCFFNSKKGKLNLNITNTPNPAKVNDTSKEKKSEHQIQAIKFTVQTL